MRRYIAVLGVFALAGCGGVKDMFSAHKDAVAVVGNRELSAQRVADLFLSSRTLPLPAGVGVRVAHRAARPAGGPAVPARGGGATCHSG